MERAFWYREGVVNDTAPWNQNSKLTCPIGFSSITLKILQTEAQKIQGAKDETVRAELVRKGQMTKLQLQWAIRDATEIYVKSGLVVGSSASTLFQVTKSEASARVAFMEDTDLAWARQDSDWKLYIG